MQGSSEKEESKRKNIRNARNGMQFRLYLIFLGLVIGIMVVMVIVQIIYTKNQMRENTKYQLQNIARNISATYGTNAYDSSIRATINSNQYVVRTMTEKGDILLDTNKLSLYIHWPDIDISIAEIRQELDHSDGYFYLERVDSEDITWIIYGQVVARWDGTREILLVAQNTLSEVQRMREQIKIMLFVLVIVLALCFFVCWFLSKSYLRPIRRITENARELAAGDYSVHFPKDSYTELNDLSETLDLAVDQFANYEQLRRDMIANLSHDMRTPLTMIKAYAEMIQTISGENPQKRDQHLDVIISQADKLSEFVNASLDLAKLQANAMPLDRTVFTLGRLVKYTMEEMQLLDKTIHVYRTHADENCKVYADVKRIKQMLQNLISNSQKYGGDVIEARVTRSREGIRMEIGDNGEGIPKDKLHDIWTKYYRINPYQEDTASAGVGLSIVKEIAELHQLKYGVESDEGAGVRFWFVFPEYVE